MPNLTPGALVRARREELGMTRDQLLAKVPALSMSTLIRIENHDGLPKARTLAALATVLDMKVEDIVGAAELSESIK